MNKMKRKILELLVIISTLWHLNVAEAQVPAEMERSAHASITLRTTGETHNEDYAEGDVMLMPSASAQMGKAKLNYDGVFRKTANTDGEVGDLQTFVHKMGIANDEWALTLGRNSLREFGGTTTTVGFDNYMSGKGLSRTFTGAFVGHQPSHLTLGIVSSDTEIGPSHWDMLMGSWSHRFDDRFGIQIHGAATQDHLEKAGLAVEWKPTDRVSLLADAVYGRDGTSAMVAGNYNLLERIKLFAGAEVTAPSDSTATGKVVAGAEGDLGHGFKAVGAVQQDISSDGQTTAVLGFKFLGTRRLF